MDAIKNLSIKWKILSLVGFVIFLEVIISVQGINYINRLNENLNHIVINDAEKVKLGARINRILVEIMRAEKSLIYEQTEIQMTPYSESIKQKTRELNEKLTKLQELISSDLEDELAQFDGLWNEFIQINKNIRALAYLNTNNKAKRLSMGMARVAFDLASISINNLVDQYDKMSSSVMDLKASRHLTEAIKLGARINRNLVEIQRAEKNIILAVYQKDMKQYVIAVDTRKIKMADRIKQLLALVEGEDEKKELTRFQKNYDKYLDLHIQVRDLALENTNIKAFELSASRGRETADKAQVIIQNIVDKNEKKLDEAKTKSDQTVSSALNMMILLAGASIIGGLLAGFIVARSISAGISNMVVVSKNIAAGALDTVIELKTGDEIGKLAGSMSIMQDTLVRARYDSESQDWLKTGIARLNETMLGEKELSTLVAKVISELATYLEARIGVFYLQQTNVKDPKLILMGSYAYTKSKNLSTSFKAGEGLVGQAALEKKQILIENVPEDYIRVTSGLGEASPTFISVTPILIEDRLIGVVELGTFHEFTHLQMEYLEQAMISVAINIEMVRSSEQAAIALEQYQGLTAELQVQQEQLKSSNAELKEQTQLLQASEEKLQVQQEELESTNEELEEMNESLERQKQALSQKRIETEQKAEELAIASKYKSEFLANMSHELRTPLNSLMLLSKYLSENKEGNLTADQVESIEVVHNSGNDLLSLINEILDLAKIESGKMDLHIEKILVNDLAEGITAGFSHMADEKGLQLKVIVSHTLPAAIITDRKRVEQIIKNLMSNAIKFTDKGHIKLELRRPQKDVNLSRNGLALDNALAISVTDTGIGIEPDKLKIVFEAFQQAEGGIARKFGGTGLGLSISRELAGILGGEIQVESKFGNGSTFTVYLPFKLKHWKKEHSTSVHDNKSSLESRMQKVVSKAQLTSIQDIPDDRENFKENDIVILVIEDDANFAKLLLNQCHDMGYKCIAAATGESGLKLENMFTRPVKDLLLDETALFLHRTIKKLPEHKRKMITDLHDSDVMFKGKKVLMVDDDMRNVFALSKVLEEKGMMVMKAENGQKALDILKIEPDIDLVLMDIMMPVMDGYEAIKQIRSQIQLQKLPIIALTAKALPKDKELCIASGASDYLEKPVDITRLSSMMRVWLYR